LESLKNSKYKKIFTILSAFTLIISYVMLEQLPLKVGSVFLNNVGKNVFLPHSINDKTGVVYSYDSVIYSSAFSSSYLRIVPDDCLKKLIVNEKIIRIDNIENICNWKSGFVINLESYLKSGENKLSFYVELKDSIGGLNIIPIQDRHSIAYRTASLIMMISLSILVFSVVRFFGFSNEISLLMVLGTLLRVIYLSYTDFDTRTYDVTLSSGHLDYIKMIANNYILPNPTQGWEYHQPPLYYIVAALFYKFGTLVTFINELVLLQILSLIQFSVFLFYSLKILSLSIYNKKILFFVSIIIIFWPSGIIHSIRLGNDVMFYMLFAISSYYTILWRQQKIKLFWALLFASLALITKSNGIILFAVIGSLLLLELYSHREYKKFFIDFRNIMIFFIIAFLINFADNIYYALQDNSKDWLVSNVINTINSKLFVNNNLENYIYFDFKTYFVEPYIDTWNDKYGRQYFWNFLFKSSLFAEFFFDNNFQITVASLIGFLSFGIFAYIIMGILLIKKVTSENYAIYLLILFFSIFALLVYRIKIPVSCNTDFRYILPVLIPMSYFYALSLEYFRDKKYIVLELFGYLQTLLLLLFSVSFFIYPMF